MIITSAHCQHLNPLDLIPHHHSFTSSDSIPNSTLLYSTLLYSTLLYSTLLHSTLLYSTLLYSALLFNLNIPLTFFLLIIPYEQPSEVHLSEERFSYSQDNKGTILLNDKYCYEKPNTTLPTYHNLSEDLRPFRCLFTV